MSNQLYLENKGKDIQLTRGGGSVDYFKVMTNNISSFLTICFATFFNCKCEGGGGWWWWKKSFITKFNNINPNGYPPPPKHRFAIYYWQVN